MFTPIHLRNVPGNPEIFDHPQFIASLAKWYKPKVFIEYGINDGTCTHVYAPYCETVYGVDINNNLRYDIPNLTLYKMSTRDFKTAVLDNMSTPVEMAFIDADHKSETVLQDFDDLFPHIADNGLIFLHDTCPCDEKWTENRYCSDSWKVPDILKKKYGELCEVITIPIQPGLTIVRKYVKLDYMLSR